MKTRIVNADITQIPVPAIATSVNSGRLWNGMVDMVITRNGGKFLYEKLAEALDSGLIGKQGDTMHVIGKPDHAAFESIIYVIDDLILPVQDITFNVLAAALSLGLPSVVIPAFRTGRVRGLAEPTVADAVKGIAQGIARFNMTYPDSELELFVCIYNNPELEALLGKQLQISA